MDSIEDRMVEGDLRNIDLIERIYDQGLNLSDNFRKYDDIVQQSTDSLQDAKRDLGDAKLRRELDSRWAEGALAGGVVGAGGSALVDKLRGKDVNKRHALIVGLLTGAAGGALQRAV
jgi:hypothetical protein